MPTSSTPCHDAFAAGQEQRRRVPLREGAYKVREGIGILVRQKKTVENIARVVAVGATFEKNELLGCCMSSDKAPFMKRIPGSIADVVGNMILPGIAALGGDGVPTAVVATVVQRAKTQASLLLQDCDCIHALLKQGIGREYAAMKAGQSHLLALLTQAEGIAREALDLAEAARHA